MTAENVPIMIAIQKKETELKVKTLEAKKDAENLLTETRKTVSGMRQTAREEADREAKAAVAKTLAKSETEARKILELADSQVDSLRRRSRGRQAKAVELVLAAVTGNTSSKGSPSRTKTDTTNPGFQAAQYVSTDGGSDVS